MSTIMTIFRYIHTKSYSENGGLYTRTVWRGEMTGFSYTVFCVNDEPTRHAAVCVNNPDAVQRPMARRLVHTPLREPMLCRCWGDHGVRRRTNMTRVGYRRQTRAADRADAATGRRVRAANSRGNAACRLTGYRGRGCTWPCVGAPLSRSEYGLDPGRKVIC